MKLWIIILHYPPSFFRLYFHSKFLSDFADNALLGRFARFKFSAGKFPAAFKIAVAALGGKDFVFVSLWICAQDYGCAYCDFFNAVCPKSQSVIFL